MFDASPLDRAAPLDRALVVLVVVVVVVVVVGVANSLVGLDWVLTVTVAFGALVTGVSGMRVPATDELVTGVVALRLTGPSAGAVT